MRLVMEHQKEIVRIRIISAILQELVRYVSITWQLYQVRVMSEVHIAVVLLQGCQYVILLRRNA